jgi:RimJ/RimL family protein N-acetyltransferase
MADAQFSIRRLTSTDAALYRHIRLEALRANPEALRSAVEAEEPQPLGWFADRLEASTVLGLFRDAQLVGVAGFAIQQGYKRAHKALLWGMYVRPSARKTGAGRRLVEAVVELARQSAELIQLTVVQDNAAARRLYASLGFVEFGLEKNALKYNGRYYDEVLMAKDLREH